MTLLPQRRSAAAVAAPDRSTSVAQAHVDICGSANCRPGGQQPAMPPTVEWRGSAWPRPSRPSVVRADIGFTDEIATRTRGSGERQIPGVRSTAPRASIAAKVSLRMASVWSLFHVKQGSGVSLARFVAPRHRGNRCPPRNGRHAATEPRFSGPPLDEGRPIRCASQSTGFWRRRRIGMRRQERRSVRRRLCRLHLPGGSRRGRCGGRTRGSGGA